MSHKQASKYSHIPKKYWWIPLVLLVIVLLAFPQYRGEILSSVFGIEIQEQAIDTNSPSSPDDAAKDQVLGFDDTPTEGDAFTFGNGKLEVIFIDVGQGDSILVKSPDDKLMLVDAGENKNKQAILDTLETNGIEHIHVVVATHPHSDHIGGMRGVLNSGITYDSVYMPEASNNTATYEKLLLAIEDHGKTVTITEAGNTIPLSSKMKVEVLGPCRTDGENLNNDSIVLRLEYGETSILLTGDAEMEEWEDMLEAYPQQLDCDVLKLSHHGSVTGLNETIMQAVSPDAAVIPVGADNDYGHPHDEVEDLLAQHHTPVYRTDTMGSILLTTDGTTIRFNKTCVYFEE